MRTLLATILAVLAAEPAAAEERWAYRVRFQGEHTSTRTNPDGPVAPPRAWESVRLFVVSGEGAYTPHERLRVGAAATGLTGGGKDGEARLREGHVRASVTSWLEVEAGKRIVRWGVGYGFAPAGVLDPERAVTDPSDRLQLNEGRTMVKADLYRRESTLTIAAADRLAAARLSTVLQRGIEIGVMAAAGPLEGARYAATVTHVVGQQLEWHGELVSHPHQRSRTLSGVAGLQYTFAAGLNVVLEYHRNGRGLDDGEWAAIRAGRRPPEPRLSRRNALFLRAARAGASVTVSPEAIVVLNTDDGSWTVVPSVTWIPQRRMQVYARAIRLAGNSRSLAGFAPGRATFNVGVVFRL